MIEVLLTRDTRQMEADGRGQASEGGASILSEPNQIETRVREAGEQARHSGTGSFGRWSRFKAKAQKAMEEAESVAKHRGFKGRRLMVREGRWR